MQNLIKVNGIKLKAFHGCLAEETKIGGDYTVDVEMKTNFEKCFNSDELIHTVDYALIYKIVREEMSIPSKLIEHVGYRIFSRINKEVPQQIEKLMVRVTKHNPPMNGQIRDVVIEIEE